MKIRVVAKNYIKANKVDAFIESSKQLVADTKAKDAGCIRYELVQDIENPTILTMMEEWEDKASLDSHMATAHFKDAMVWFSDFAEKPGEITLYKTLI